MGFIFVFGAKGQGSAYWDPEVSYSDSSSDVPEDSTGADSAFVVQPMIALFIVVMTTLFNL